MDLELSGQVALVVGGTGVIGSAVAARLREEGAEVLVASRHPGTGGLRMDAADDASVTESVQQVLAEHGRLDAVVITSAPSAGTLDPAKGNDPDQVAAAIGGKALTFLRVANAVVPAMRQAGYGRIVGISGQNAWLTGTVAGPARNAVLIVAAKNLADQLAGTGVTVNVVNPGLVTEAPAAAVKPGAGGESSPAQIADLVAFLASPRSALSGESIAIAHRARGFTTL